MDKINKMAAKEIPTWLFVQNMLKRLTVQEREEALSIFCKDCKTEREISKDGCRRPCCCTWDE